MEFNSGAALAAGVLAGLIMLVPMYMGLAMMPNLMKMDMLKLLGTMMMPVSGMTYPIGLMVHLGASIVFALIHVAFFNLFDIDSAFAAWGILFGLVHAVIAGIGFGMMPIMHKGIKDGVVDAPGFMTLNLPMATVAGFVMVHVIYGVLVGAFYEAFI